MWGWQGGGRERAGRPGKRSGVSRQRSRSKFLPPQIVRRCLVSLVVPGDQRACHHIMASPAPRPGCLRWAVDIARWTPEPPELDFLLALLPPEEAEHCRKFRFPDDTKRGLVSRLLQRACGAAVLGVPFREAVIRRTRGKKPYLADAQRPAEAPNFNYSVSHEVGWGLRSGVGDWAGGVRRPAPGGAGAPPPIPPLRPPAPHPGLTSSAGPPLRGPAGRLCGAGLGAALRGGLRRGGAQPGAPSPPPPPLPSPCTLPTSSECSLFSTPLLLGEALSCRGHARSCACPRTARLQVRRQRSQSLAEFFKYFQQQFTAAEVGGARRVERGSSP